MNNPSELLIHFDSLYGNGQKADVFFAPGRVNLIGEHTDYNNGYVLPLAIQLGTLLAIRPNNSGLFRFASLNMDFRADIPVTDNLNASATSWIRYPSGIIEQFQKKGHVFSGLDFLFWGDLPNGAGLSSSASIEIVTAYALKKLFDIPISKVELARLARKSENEFIGVQCGIMDMFAVALGRKDHALFLNCGTLESADVPLHLKEYTFLIADTQKERKLSESKYNERVEECAIALKQMPHYSHKTNLSRFSIEEFERLNHHIKEERIRKRARHIISENERVFESVKALNNGQLERFGLLMNASHDSLRLDYDVTGKELDALVYAAREVPGVLGSRMTGAGFGGCSISLLHQDAVADFKEIVAEKYHEETGLTAAFYEVHAQGGPTKLD